MFDLKNIEEDIIMEITASSEVGKKDTIDNVIREMKTKEGKEDLEQINIILTIDAIFIVNKGQASEGKIQKINMVDVNEFLVWAKKGYQIIEIQCENKNFVFLKEKNNSDKSASAMAKVINNILFIIND